MPRYQYSRLQVETQEIRLVTLLAGKFSDAIRYSISHKANPDPALEFTSWEHPSPSFDPCIINDEDNRDIIEVQPQFEALSYTWGSPKNPEISYVEVIDEKQHSTTLYTLEIGQNLALALRHLRRSDDSRVLWIDAISINQEDIKERETQVMRMGDIYRHAHRVVVWLGPSFVKSHLAISALEFIGKQVEATKNDWVYQSPDCTEPQWYHARCVLPYTEKVWHATQTLLEFPWFQRVWIVQEIQLANERCMMICGDKEISWYLFRRGIILLFGKRNHLPETLRPLIERVAELSRTLTSDPLQALLIVARRNLCKEPVDKIFGILGLTSPLFESKVRPNYSLSASEVYKSILLEQSFLSSRLELLASCDSRVPRMVGLPSWVPDCNKALDTTQDLADFARRIGSRATGHSYVTGEDLLDAYAWTLSSGTLRDRYKALQHYPTHAEMKELILHHTTKASKETSDKKLSDKFERFVQYSKGKSFMEATNGYIGIGISSVRPGDMVCTILGCSHPLLLRPNSEGTFEVIGPCYLHGIMYGESLLGPLPHPWEYQLLDMKDGGGAFEPWYLNPTTNIHTRDDPRLGELPPEWDKVEDRERTRDDPVFVSWYRNKTSGEEINSDPRLTPEALQY
ncbi:uncharacterized protein PAC_16264 [Phialocephala subalpina]|uniref:Heterokaryon incompatibility domain-containing protein n=1 Tax=Phialocephala subalpina TaxID=576137 RepID=A0A1L7XMV6_9HELO|nr:uncharacterized protein PAC_16264 [Phialocephala subalpina]